MMPDPLYPCSVCSVDVAAISGSGVSDVNSSGLKFTWNQKPRGGDGVLKKIDRIMANMEFNDMFVGSGALFQPYLNPQEVRNAIFSMGNDKLPSPDGYTATFFKEVWDIISTDVIKKGYIKGKGGLRQGDPLSPYLFTLVMEVLTFMLCHRVRDSDCFTYPHHCSELNIINLCFADHLFLFAHGDVQSARVIMEALDEFKNALGFVPSMLPVKYLGVPLGSSRLIYRNYKELVEKVKNKINDWKNKFLSFAGKVQLVHSVLASMNKDLNELDLGFSVAVVWDCIRPRGNEIDWQDLVWFLALGWLLEEIHVTWAHLEKKRTRLRTYTKSHDDFCKQWLETASQA
ncbi:putative reverse transcriptase domain, reverse transcriptase zinc-binding domain protein [Tanacetum coccineum]